MGVHDGHRARMKARFVRSGLDNFDDHSVLELLLFYAVPRRDVNELAHALLNHSNLRIVTNNLNVANTLMVKEDFRIILAGGELRSRDGGIIGEATLDFISQFRLDFGILGISGIDSDGSLLEFDYHEVRTKRAIIENSRHVMLVVDHSKFGRNAMVNMGSISMVDAVYTDAPPPVSVMQVLTDHHIQLELC